MVASQTLDEIEQQADDKGIDARRWNEYVLLVDAAKAGQIVTADYHETIRISGRVWLKITDDNYGH